MEFQDSEFHFRLFGPWVLRRDDTLKNLCFILCFNDERIDLLRVVISRLKVLDRLKIVCSLICHRLICLRGNDSLLVD